MLRRRDPDHPAPEHTPAGWTPPPRSPPTPTAPAPTRSPSTATTSSTPTTCWAPWNLGHGLHGSPTLAVHGATGEELAAQLVEPTQRDHRHRRARGQGLTATAESLTVVSAETFDPGLISAAERGEQTPLYTLRYNAATNSIDYWAGHDWEPNHTPKTLLAETRELIDLRDVATSLITSQRDGAPRPNATSCAGTSTPSTTTTCAATARSTASPGSTPKTPPKSATTRKWSPLEARWRDKEGEPGAPYRGPVPDELAEQWDAAAWATPAPYKKRRHLDGGMRHDPGWAVVVRTGNLRRRHRPGPQSPDLLHRPAQRRRDAPDRRQSRRSAGDEPGPHPACRPDLIARLLDVPIDDARALIAGLVYPSLDDPDELVPATTALSGNVRDKYGRPRAAAAHTTPSTATTLEALREVVPRDRTAEDISARPGAPWIPATRRRAVRRSETFGVDGVTAEHVGGRWVVDVAGLQALRPADDRDVGHGLQRLRRGQSA